MQQLSLFEEEEFPPIDYFGEFLTPNEADQFFLYSLTLDWQQNKMTLPNRKEVLVPRLECSYGDPGCSYTYSNSVKLTPLDWTQTLLHLRNKVEAIAAQEFNICIGERYRSGRDSIGWHAEKAPEMGIDPAIAIVSLGHERNLQIKKLGGSVFDVWLQHGSLLLMKSGMQNRWIHQIPKSPRYFLKHRIALSFRPHIAGSVRF